MTVWDGVQRGYIPGEMLRIPDTLKLHTGTADVDPVTFEVIRYSLMNTNREHGQTIQRLAVSPVTMITRDFQPSILTASGDLVFLGPYLQYFSNAQALTVKWLLENRSENPGIEPGDMFVSNDPYVGTPHQPDTIVAAPVFVGDELFCWVANVLHHADVGGSVMGSFCVDATDIFADPPAFPPFKLVSRGEVRRDLEEMFLRQSRVPTNVHMDLRAAVSANRVAVGRIVALVDRYGANAVKSVMNRVLDAGERTVAERLAKIPAGRWSHRLYAEAAHTGDAGIYTYQITVRKQGEYLYVDNAGTDPQTGSINVTYAGFSGAFLAALTASLTADLADLAGAYGGVHSTGEPFVATNADNMIGSLAASPAGDGVDFGGHFWILRAPPATSRSSSCSGRCCSSTGGRSRPARMAPAVPRRARVRRSRDPVDRAGHGRGGVRGRVLPQDRRALRRQSRLGRALPAQARHRRHRSARRRGGAAGLRRDRRRRGRGRGEGPHAHDGRRRGVGMDRCERPWLRRPAYPASRPSGSRHRHRGAGD
jgi:Hydantoinase B/oxoprolinase